MKIKEISYSETEKKPGSERFSSFSRTISAKADINESENAEIALKELKVFVRTQLYSRK